MTTDEGDPMVQPAMAAAQLGLNRSTLCRQIAQGKIRSHGGLVRLSEVRADRASNLHQGRSRRRDGVRDHDATEAATAVSATADEQRVLLGATCQALDVGALEGVSRNDLAAAVASAVVQRIEAAAAGAAVVAGADMALAYRVARVVGVEAAYAAETALSELGVLVVEEWADKLAGAADEPDWAALAKSADEPCVLKAWHQKWVARPHPDPADGPTCPPTVGRILSEDERVAEIERRREWTRAAIASIGAH